MSFGVSFSYSVGDLFVVCGEGHSAAFCLGLSCCFFEFPSPCLPLLPHLPYPLHRLDLHFNYLMHVQMFMPPVPYLKGMKSCKHLSENKLN